MGSVADTVIPVPVTAGNNCIVLIYAIIVPLIPFHREFTRLLSLHSDNATVKLAVRPMLVYHRLVRLPSKLQAGIILKGNKLP